MDPHRSPRSIAAAWRPERAGRRAAHQVADALVEPDWGGARVAVALGPTGRSAWRDGNEVPLDEDLAGALSAAFLATEAVVEGHLTTVALRSSVGRLPALAEVERPSLLVPRRGRRGAARDPFVHARDHEILADAAADETLVALAAGERHAFVATDLLLLDGTPLEAIPLLERKRHLETVLDPSELVRVSAYVGASARMTHVSWGALGFAELVHRAANARYLAGRENPDRAVAPAPTEAQALRR